MQHILSKNVFKILSKKDIRLETFTIFLYDSNMRFLKAVDIGLGGINTCEVNTQRFIIECLSVPTHTVITAHNHPNKKIKPSTNDKYVWKKLARICTDINLNLLTNLIYNEKNAYSSLDRKIYDL